MLKEVGSGVRFLTDFLSRNGIVPKHKVEQFSLTLESLLCKKYDNHWFPQKPNQGSGYRCIRITQTIMDPEVEKAARVSGVSFDDLKNTIPKEFTMWIDPSDVSYRIGEDGSICALEFDLKTGVVDMLQVSSTSMMQKRCRTEACGKPDLIETKSSAFAQC